MDRAGPALNASMIDMGERFRMLVNTVEARKTSADPYPNFLWRGTLETLA